MVAAQPARPGASTAAAILVLGLSYKAGTSDWRESPSIAVVERLLRHGRRRAGVRALHARRPAPTRCRSPVVDCTPDELAAADLVVVLVDHPEFPLDDIAEHAPLRARHQGRHAPREFTGETL